MAGILYRLTFPNGKSYIGITSKSLNNRLRSHQIHAVRRQGGELQHALRGCNAEAVISEVLMITESQHYLREMERQAIISFKTRSPAGYNMTAGGEGLNKLDRQKFPARQCFSITKGQTEWLKSKTDQLDISVGELMRRLLDQARGT